MDAEGEGRGMAPKGCAHAVIIVHCCGRELWGGVRGAKDYRYLFLHGRSWLVRGECVANHLGGCSARTGIAIPLRGELHSTALRTNGLHLHVIRAQWVKSSYRHLVIQCTK